MKTKVLGCSILLVAGLVNVDRIVKAQSAESAPPAAKGGAKKGSGGGGLRAPAQKELIYVTLPGSLERPWDNNGNGIVVLDPTNHYGFIKRIPVFEVPASQYPEQIAGVTASPVTNMIYIAARG